MDEPSVLDYLKSFLTPWKKTEKVEFQPDVPFELDEIADWEEETPAPELQPLWKKTFRGKYLPIFSLVLGLLAQRSFEPPNHDIRQGVFLYLLAALLLILAYTKELNAVHRTDLVAEITPYKIHRQALTFGMIFCGLAFITFGGNSFTTLNIFLWLLAIAYFVRAFWVAKWDFRELPRRFSAILHRSSWQIEIKPRMILILAAIALVLFFRIYRINQVPSEMISDHAEKLLDVSDILKGETHIFFPRNTGREGLQMYMTAAITLLFGTGLSFLSLKIGTIVAGLLTLPFIYKLGKELQNKRAGFFAFLFAGIAYWPNVISRAGLRFPLYMLFTAPTLYYLVRGLKRTSRNDFILSGVFLGLGLHGYTPIRILPFVIVLILLIAALHRRERDEQWAAFLGLGLLALFAFLLFLPLFRFALEEPSLFAQRAFSRITSSEQAFSGNIGLVFLQNLWNAITMFAWSNGGIWLVSVANRPALDVVSSALFHMGIVYILLRYLHQRRWEDLTLLLLVPLLLLPSILSLAFPGENPAPNRASGAVIPVFLIVGIMLDVLIRAVESHAVEHKRSYLGWILAGVVTFWSIFSNYDLVFNQYASSYAAASWNTTELGGVIRSFAQTIGARDQAWVIPYPYWVDNRLVGINAGFPEKNYELPSDQIEQTIEVPGAKLFLVNTQDHESLEKLKSIYPRGAAQLYTSQLEGHDFMIFFTPSENVDSGTISP